MVDNSIPESPFADLADLEARGGLIPPDKTSLAETLLSDASQMLLDEMPAAVARASEATLTRIVCAMVLRALDDSSPLPLGVESHQWSIGPFQESMRAHNPSDNLYLTRAERRALRGPQRAFMIDLAPPGAGREYRPVEDFL